MRIPHSFCIYYSFYRASYLWPAQDPFGMSYIQIKYQVQMICLMEYAYMVLLRFCTTNTKTHQYMTCVHISWDVVHSMDSKDTSVLNRCLIDIDQRGFTIWEVVWKIFVYPLRGTQLVTEIWRLTSWILLLVASHPVEGYLFLDLFAFLSHQLWRTYEKS